MTRKVALLSAVLFTTGRVLSCQAATDSISVVRQFLSPGSSIEQISKRALPAGKAMKQGPAILQIAAEGKTDIVFAESREFDEKKSRVLSINILQPDGKRYFRVFSRTYYDKRLFQQNGATIGLQEVKLSDDKSGLLVITFQGASLGADVEIFIWKEGLGFVNVAPNVGGGHEVIWANPGGKLQMRISFQKYPGERNVPPPILLEWNETQQEMLIAKGPGG